MERKIPSVSTARDAIARVVRSRKLVESQEELASLALRELRKKDKDYRLTPTRAKRIALQMDEIEIKAKTKKSVGLQKIDKCPICESKIKPIRIRNLANKQIIVGYSCTSCGYESDLEAFLPMKYEFIWKKAKL